MPYMDLPDGTLHGPSEDYAHVCRCGGTWCSCCRRCDQQYEERDPCYACLPSGDDWDDDHDREVLHDYNYRRSLVFYSLEGRGGSEADSPDSFFGIELEAECRDDYEENRSIANLVRATNNVFFAKRDSSLENGAEFVSDPMTLSFAQALDWSPFERLLQAGWLAWDTRTAGMHVHVSRQAFAKRNIANALRATDGRYNFPGRLSRPSDAHLLRFSWLITKNRRFMTRFAGRDNHQWADFGGASDAVKDGIKDRKQSDSARYVPVNLRNRDTVEVRIFRGTLRKDRILSNIELVDSLVEYTRNMTVPEVRNGALTIAAWLPWVKDKVDRYPHLVEYVDSPRFSRYRPFRADPDDPDYQYPRLADMPETVEESPCAF